MQFIVLAIGSVMTLAGTIGLFAKKPWNRIRNTRDAITLTLMGIVVVILAFPPRAEPTVDTQTGSPQTKVSSDTGTPFETPIVAPQRAAPASPPPVPHKAPIQEGAYTPLTKGNAPKLFAAWGKPGVDRVNEAVRKAVAIAATSPRCDQVEIGGYSYEKSVPKTSIVVFVDCSNTERFYFTEEETKAGSLAAPISSKISSIKDSAALGGCKAVAEKQVRFASTMDVSYLSSSVDRRPYGINVALAFEAKNSFGAMLPYVAYCNITPDGTASLISIKER